jgi:hypothetical protein
MTSVNVGDSTKASTMNQAIANLLNLKSDLFLKTKMGDQTAVSQDVSVLREFECSATSGDVFNIVKNYGDNTGQVMKGISHGMTISQTGAIGPRDETQACWFVVWTEKGLFQRYEEPSSNSPYTAGGTPTFVCAAPTYGLLGGLTSGGSANAQTLDYDIPAYYSGLALMFKGGFSTTGATTMNVRGLGTRAVKNQSGLDLTTGDINAGGVYIIWDNGTNFVLLNPSISANLSAALIGSTANNHLRKMKISCTLHAATGGGGYGDLTASGGAVVSMANYVSGTSYAVGDFVIVYAGNHDAILKVLTVSGGNPTSFAVIYGGTGYSSGSFTGVIAIASYSYQSVQTTGTAFNVSGIQDSTASAFFTGFAGNATASVGSGPTAVTYGVGTMSTTETITAILSGAGVTVSGGNFAGLPTTTTTADVTYITGGVA